MKKIPADTAATEITKWRIVKAVKTASLPSHLFASNNSLEIHVDNRSAVDLINYATENKMHFCAFPQVRVLL